jgi:NADP-dependent 3-hydroxy acid dehydrogenase YdfG
MSKIQDKVVVIMGASSGIGEATTKKLAQEGAKLVIAARREDRLKALVESLPSAADISYAVADVTDKDDVQAVIDLAVKRHGRIDVLYNNAGVMPLAPLSETRFDEWRQMLNINIMGVLNGIAAVLPIMRNQQSGQIIATDSVAGHAVWPGSAVYSGTKFAVRAIMEGLRQEERENNIRSTMISPGAVDTELYNTINDPETQEAARNSARTEGYGIKSEDVADAVAYAISTPESVSISEILIRPTKQAL